ncbi:MAG TPA: ATP-binding cassette domain-containing protein [Acidimicrobiales bacterium]|nr:ATP-binding cassette domain-containing protein [Acidimicrobiales bacterium]
MAEDIDIAVDDCYKAFGSNKVMDGLTIDFYRDTITTVLGPSGTGKSVLIKHILGLMYPDKGDIRVFGRSLRAMGDDELFKVRESFGVLFQDGALFGSMNLYDNVAFPLRQHTKYPEDKIRRIVMSNMKDVGLQNAIYKMPGEISGGMRKRAGFARALVMQPQIVMFDEPDSGLDPVRTSLLNDLILDIHSKYGGTYLIVTHDIRSARKVAEYIGLLWKGRVVHWGKADEAFASEKPFVKQFLAGESAGPLGMD